MPLWEGEVLDIGLQNPGKVYFDGYLALNIIPFPTIILKPMVN